MKGYRHHCLFCPKSRGDEYIYTSVESRPLSMSFVHLAPPSLLPTARPYVSHIDKACLWHINPMPLIKGNCEGGTFEVVGWGHKMEKKQRQRVAAKELATGRTWHVTLSRWVAQSAATAHSCGFSQPHNLKHQKCLSPDGKRQRSLLGLRKRNLRGLRELSSRMVEGIYWTWFLVWICLTKAFVLLPNWDLILDVLRIWKDSRLASGLWLEPSLLSIDL